MDRAHRGFAVGAAIWSLLVPWVVDLFPLRMRLMRAGFTPESTEAWATVIVCAGGTLAAYVALFIVAPATLRWIAAGESSAEPR